MNKIIFSLFLFSTYLFSAGMTAETNEVDCLVLESENSIICKYVNEKFEDDKFVRVEWIDPTGVISRDRKVLMAKGHRSIYDFRYISGRIKGVWTFKATDAENTYSTTFEIK